MEILPKEIDPKRILELGAGTGILTKMLLEQFPDSQIDALDLSEGMVEHGQKTIPSVNWMLGDAQTWNSPHTYSLLASSAALHWTTHLSATFTHLHHLLNPGGYFVLGMMLEGTLGELHALRQEIAPQKQSPQKLPSLSAVQEAIASSPFKILQTEEKKDPVFYSDATTLLRALNEQGVTGGSFGTGNTPLNRTELRQLTTLYQTRFTTTQGIPATYHTALFLLQSPDSF
jgi:malonyl-CoA O-methyltransferase